MTMGVLWDTGDMEKASIYSVASEKGDAGAARADAAKRAGGARCGAGEARRATRIGAKGTLRTVDARVKIGLLVAYSVALFCTENLLGLGVAAALLAAVASVGDVPVARLLREGAFAYLLVGFLLVYNVAASGWLAGIAVALRLLLLWRRAATELPACRRRLTGAVSPLATGRPSSSALSPALPSRLFPRSLRQGRCRPRRLSECCAT